MHTSGQEQRGAGALEVVEANVALPDEHFGSDAGRHRDPSSRSARVYAINRTSIAPSGSSRIAKASAVVAIGVGRRSVGGGNGAR